MSFYTALTAAWNGGTQPPTGVTGTALTGLTTTAKIAAVNAWTVSSPKAAILTPSQIINAIVFADLVALSTTQLQQLTLLLSGASVDASINTPIRAGIQALFATKTTTLANLGTLVAPFDNATALWTAANGYPTLNANDATAAGLS